jgi:hypothetical protein
VRGSCNREVSLRLPIACAGTTRVEGLGAAKRVRISCNCEAGLRLRIACASNTCVVRLGAANGVYASYLRAPGPRL